jgi:hypothetical protein
MAWGTFVRIPLTPQLTIDHAQANVMLSYKLPAAITLLSSKLDVAQSSLNNTIEDLEFIREQLTIMEVNTARVYNLDVKRRRDKREKEAAKLSGGKSDK